MASKRKTITGVLDSGSAGDIEVVKKAFEVSIKKYGGVVLKDTKGDPLGMLKRVYVDTETGYLMGEFSMVPGADEAEVELLIEGLAPVDLSKKSRRNKK